MNGIEIQGKYFRNLIQYIIPSAYALTSNSVALMIVSVWISGWVGNNALGAISIVAPYLSFVYAFGLIFGAGGGTIAAKYTAKGDSIKADSVFTLSLLLLIVSVSIVGAVTYLNLSSLTALLGATEENFYLVEEYFKYISISSVLFAVGYTMNIYLRFGGYQFRACIGSTLNSVIILLASYAFIRVLNLGIAGAALGLIASRVVIILYYMGHFMSRHKGLRFRFQKAGMLKEMKQIFSIGVPNALGEASVGIFILIFNYVVLHWLGTGGLVIFSVVYYLYQLTLGFAIGIGQGVQPIISYHFAKNNDPLRYKYLRYALGLTAALSVCFTVAGIAFSDQIVGMYISSANPLLWAQAVSALKIFSWFSLAAGFNIIFIAYFSSVDRASWAMSLSWGRGLVIICAAGIGLPFILGHAGIWIAPVVTEFIVLVLVFFYCKKDRILKELMPAKLKTA